jgi:hypothetical protein
MLNKREMNEGALEHVCKIGEVDLVAKLLWHAKNNKYKGLTIPKDRIK